VKYGCYGCHDIPVIPHGAGAHVGPALGGIGSRRFIAGRVPNHPDSMVKYLMNPQAVDSDSRMPSLGIHEQEAKDIAAFLYTLK
jgi:cytochrome c2